MYQRLIKPILFKLNIEQSHALVKWALKFIGAAPGGRRLLRWFYACEHPSLERDVMGIHFKNPIGLAAGFDVDGDVINECSDLGFGFVEIGTITPKPQIGNLKPRVYRLPKDLAIVNRMGHCNKGWQYAINNLRNAHPGVVVGCNIGRCSDTNPKQVATDYLKSFRTLYQYADYFTINITSDFASQEIKNHAVDSVKSIIAPLVDFRRGQSEYRPILLKISPDLRYDALDDIISILVDTQLDGIVAVAGTHSREDLNTSGESIDQIGNGRLSGRPLTQRAVDIVSYIHRKTNGAYTIIGVGGVMTPHDVKAMLEAGASLVQLYTGFIYEGPSLIKYICESLIVEEKEN